ncbi:MAG: Ig-like domain-containing protein [Micrococcales bacterium]|nr:Ig-like domain-containing protein [Micrococcales bacterium]
MITSTTRARRRFPVQGVAAGVLVGAVVVGAVVAQGYDAQRTSRVESSVWVVRDAGQYARFDTDLAQIDTVRTVEDPSAVVQHGSSAAVLTQGLRTLWSVDPAVPTDLSAGQEHAPGSVTTPDGTVAVAAAGDRVLYRTDVGAVWAGTLSDVEAPPTRLEPDPAADPTATTQYAATAATIDAEGRVAVYSAAERAVRLLDASTGALVSGPVTVAAAPAKDSDVQLALISGRWVMLDADGGRVWTSAHTSPIRVELGADARLESSGDHGRSVYVADGDGLLEIDVRSGSVNRVVQARGTPARPVVMNDGVVVAAWLTPTGGQMWTSDHSATRPLAVADGGIDTQQQPHPVIATNGDRAVLQETGTGLMWTVPDGTAIPVSQWSRIDQETTTTGTAKVTEVTEQMPPVAVDDTFGVRPGQHVRLPVLLNDHDPNSGDVLTIVPDSISPLSDPGFAELTLTDNDQLLVARVTATAGSATFTYQVTDGTDFSEPATVTLVVVEESASAAPEWCGVDQCTQTWPTPSLAPGGTVRVRVLDAWVSPQGDPFVLSSALVEDQSAPLQVVAASDGTLTIHHTDPNGSSASEQVTLTVTDSRGQEATRALNVQVTSSPTLELEAVALVTGKDTPATMTVADHVRSGSGSYRLVDAVPSAASADALDVVTNPADGTLSVTPRRLGQHQITYTVHDEVTGAEKSALLRISCPEGASTLSMAPMTAFVRSHQDTTVDVLAAVHTTSDRVLVLAQATGQTANEETRLGVDVVDGSLLRLRGSTQGDQPGLVGTVTVTVSDGASLSTTGTVAVFLVPSVFGQPPIAVPDAVTVRAGAQVDIPVTANDVAPGGAELQLSPEVVGSGAAGEMIFTSGNTLRYVAPDQPGSYQLRYSVSIAGYPEALATSTVQVTVVPVGVNRDPTPPSLVARVPAGQIVHIPHRPFGADPDGDPVALVGVDQPPAGHGAASIADTGDAIVFQAPAAPAGGGQVTFAYRVRDPGGAEGTGTVRVAVMPADSGAAPVAYTDRVRLRAGDPEPAVIEPLLNDRDPSGGRLTITAVRPDAPSTENNPERARLEGLLDTSTMADGRVTVRAGDVLGTHSYVYTVRSSATGSTAEGLLVVEVTAGSNPDTPVVRDTVVTAAQRADLSRTGVDVVAGKVVWPAGDVSRLTLSVWGRAADRYTVSGTRISGPLPSGAELVPFRLTGTDRTGREVSAYGFLRIPAFDDMRVSPSPDAKVVEVEEGGTVKIPLSGWVALATGDTLQVADVASFPVQRPEASCTRDGANGLTYRAGNGAPWSDTCVVRVRLAGQTTWTDLFVAIRVAPKAPQPQLSSLSRTVPPGSTETIDLRSMTSWEGGRVGDESRLVYQTHMTSPAFEMSQDGSTLRVTASARSVPGTRATVNVTMTSYGGLSSTIELVVGQASPDTPRGATVSASCDVSRQSSCTIPVVGVPGEHDPFAGKLDGGLTLAHLGAGAAECSVATVRAADTRAITATWPADPKPAGGTCQVAFTVIDAQGRPGPGLLLLDVQGFPPRPQSLTLADYSADSVTLDVTLGAANQAHPAVSGAAIYEGGRRVSDACVPSGAGTYRCTVSSLNNGQQHTFTARVRNAVGESEDTTPVTVWAYDAPTIHSVSAEPVYVAGRTTEATGVVRVSITSSPDTNRFRIEGQPGTFDREDGPVTVVLVNMPVGPQTVSVTPVNQAGPPRGGDGGGVTRQVSVLVAGSPKVSVGSVTRPTPTTVTVAGAGIDANGSTLGTSLTYGRSTTAGVTCSESGVLVGGGVHTQASPTFAGLENNQQYWFWVCGTNGFGGAGGQVGGSPLVIFTAGPPEGTARYSISTTPNVDQQGNRITFTYNLGERPSLTAVAGASVQYSFDGGASWRGDFDGWPGWGNRTVPGTILARQCSNVHPNACSEVREITPSGQARATVAVTCSPGNDPFSFSPPAARDSADVTLTEDENGSVWRLDWRAGTPYTGLASLTRTNNVCAIP